MRREDEKERNVRRAKEDLDVQGGSNVGSLKEEPGTMAHIKEADEHIGKGEQSAKYPTSVRAHEAPPLRSEKRGNRYHSSRRRHPDGSIRKRLPQTKS